MYGFKEAAILAYDQLKDHLAKYGYIPFKHTPGMWHHTTQPPTFTLTVDDFGIKYFSNQDANHLLSALKDKYSITINWSGDLYLGLNIYWQYDKAYVEISISKVQAPHSSSLTTCTTCMDCSSVWAETQ